MATATSGDGRTPLDTSPCCTTPTGVFLAGDDDGGPGFDSLLRYAVPADGTYFVAVSGFFVAPRGSVRPGERHRGGERG